VHLTDTKDASRNGPDNPRIHAFDYRSVGAATRTFVQFASLNQSGKVFKSALRGTIDRTALALCDQCPREILGIEWAQILK
jgi:hypothetical protein